MATIAAAGQLTNTVQTAFDLKKPQLKTGSHRLELWIRDPNSLVLPLHYEPICKYLGVKGFEPSKPLASDLQSEVTLQRYRTPVKY